MSFLFNNRAISHLSFPITDEDSEIRIPWQDFNSFMRSNARSGDSMIAILRGPIEREIVGIDLVNSFSGTTDKYLKVARGQGGTSSMAWPAGTLLFISTHADHYESLFQPEGTRQIDYNPNGVLSPLYAGEKIFQYGGCEIRWWMSFDAVNPYWHLIAGLPCEGEIYADPGWGFPVWNPGKDSVHIFRGSQNDPPACWYEGGPNPPAVPPFWPGRGSWDAVNEWWHAPFSQAGPWECPVGSGMFPSHLYVLFHYYHIGLPFKEIDCRLSCPDLLGGFDYRTITGIKVFINGDDTGSEYFSYDLKICEIADYTSSATGSFMECAASGVEYPVTFDPAGPPPGTFDIIRSLHIFVHGTSKFITDLEFFY
jgi:hypothetical protein